MIRNVLLGIKLLSAAICPLQRSMHQRCTFSLPVGSGQDSEHPSAPSSVHTQQILLALSGLLMVREDDGRGACAAGVQDGPGAEGVTPLSPWGAL